MSRLLLAGFIVVAAIAAEPQSSIVQVPCALGGAACGEALQRAIDEAAPGTTIALDPGKVYEGPFVVPSRPEPSNGRRILITTRGWDDKGTGWNGLVTPADKPRMAILRAAPRRNTVIDIQNGPAGGNVVLLGVAFEALRPAGQGEIIRIGSPTETSAANMASRVSIRQVLIQGDRQFGQKRGIAVHGRDIDIGQVWCDEMFIAGQDAQCIATWNGGKHVRIRYSYLAAGAENLIIGGAPIASAEMEAEDWLIEDVILHKPLRWQQDGANRQVKNLLEFKQGKHITVRRVLAVNNWAAAQDGMGLLINYTTTGRCPQCGGLEDVLIEDLVMLNVEGGVSFQGYSWNSESHNSRKLQNVTLRNSYIQLSGSGRSLLISNVLDRHNIRVERSTFVNGDSAWLTGSFGRAWLDQDTPTRGGPMVGLWLIDNVFTQNGRYGITAPDGRHFGSGIGAFVSGDLQIAGNVIGDAPADHLANYNKYTAGGPANESASGDRMRASLTAGGCAEWGRGKGADCARLAPVFALVKRLPEP